MILYIRISKDKYELPIAVADTVTELAKMCGVRRDTIYQMMSRYGALGKWCPYRKVEVEDD